MNCEVIWDIKDNLKNGKVVAKIAVSVARGGNTPTLLGADLADTVGLLWNSSSEQVYKAVGSIIQALGEILALIYPMFQG